MKKVLVMFSVVAFLFTMNINAQEPKAKSKAVKTEKAAATKADKKECSSESGSKACCAKKKVAAS